MLPLDEPLMALPAASKAGRCSRRINSITPVAIVPSGFAVPCFLPGQTGATCTHEQFLKGKGCVKDVNWELGGIQRVTLDRESPLYKAIYTQRTRLVSASIARPRNWGTLRPKVRNGRSVANLNTLIYLVINVRAIKRTQSINDGLLSIQKGIR